MEVAVIVLGTFVVLLFIVAVLLGNKYLKFKNRLKEVETDLEEYTNAAKEDAKTIYALRNEIKSLKTLIDEVENKQLSQSQVTKTSDKEWSEEDEELLDSLVKEIESELKKPYFEGYDLICNKKISWLNSLKERISL